MTILEAVKKGSIRVQFGNRFMSYLGDEWYVYKKRRGHTTNLITTKDEEEAVKVLLEGVKND